MPEGPEVKRTVDFLKSAFKNNESIKDIEIVSGRYAKGKPFQGYNDMSFEIPLVVRKVSCKGKFIYFLFDNLASLTTPPCGPVITTDCILTPVH